MMQQAVRIAFAARRWNRDDATDAGDCHWVARHLHHFFHHTHMADQLFIFIAQKVNVFSPALKVQMLYAKRIITPPQQDAAVIITQ